MLAVIKKLILWEDGQGMAEYALILSMVVLLALYGFSQMPAPLNALFNKVIDAFNGESSMPKFGPAGNWDHSPAVFKT